MNNYLFLLLFTVLFACKKDPAFPKVEFVREDSAGVVSSGNTCNGYPELCEKRYDEVVYVTTHNAFNAEYGDPANYLFPNQKYRISTQLKEGVRGLMIDVHPYNGSDSALSGKPFVYHGFSWTGSEPLVNILSEIKFFLDSNPREIVTIIFECYVASEDIASAMNESGLAGYLFTHNTGAQWETLSKIIESDKRLIVFSDVNDAGNFSWYHYLWDYCAETGYSAHSKEELDCNYNRGDSSNSLFILNHFITQNFIGTGLPDMATEINSNPFLINKARECMNIHGKLPNFITVDFYSEGNVFDAARELNGVK